MTTSKIVKTVCGAALCGALALAVLPATGSAAAGDKAVAELKTVDGKSVGTVAFQDTPSGVLWVTAALTGLPAGKHGFHIHQTGACDAGDGFKSAGGHLTGGHGHGVMAPDGPHAGDLPNLSAPDDGAVTIEAFVPALPGDGGWFGPAGLFDGDGAAVVIHAGADDYASQPAGAAGDRLACGVIAKR